MTLVAQLLWRAVTMKIMICRQHTLQRRARASVRFNRITTAKRLISFSTSQEKSWQVSLRGRGRFIALHVIIARNESAHPNENPSWWNLILNCDQTEAHWRDCNQISRFGEHYCEVYTRIFFAHLKVLINSYAIREYILYYNCNYIATREIKIMRNIWNITFVS